MRILFVVPSVPSFIRPRPFHFIRGVSQAHEVSTLCLATNESDEQYVSQLRQYSHSLEIVRVSRWRSLWNCLLALFSKKSLRCAYFYSPGVRDLITARVEANEVDLIHAEHLKSLPMLKGVIGQVPVVFDAVDCLSMLESKRGAITRNLFVKLFSWMESKKAAAAESKALPLVNRMTISSPVDREAYPVSMRLRERIDVILNGVDLEHFGFRQFESQKNLLVFCAKLDYFPNEDAALHFARCVWPRLRARRPELQFEIVGSRPPRTVRQLDGRQGIRVIASVPDVRPYLGRAGVALCPIRIRAGIQNKILEAMAMGVPVVSTPICCTGLQVHPGKHLLAAADPDQFISAIELLLDNPMLRERLIEAGRAYVERNHNWAESIRALSNCYKAAVADFSARSGRSYPVVIGP
jgi:polysaccharide biosynthesis protein PslH